MWKKGFILGFGCATAGRALLPKLLRLKFGQDLKGTPFASAKDETRS